ncbi:hypothetical protein [Roseiterribacter gracilis]|uniref:Uncharacterized protein n=1 Tax=Roseiterribacter gracilis TaxID=2812848 RepID=A0A8S8XHH3_9PROT|nr:hypothetical protein TMPK1_29330 [Rhodospirillales bacterium TMPK1]
MPSAKPKRTAGERSLVLLTGLMDQGRLLAASVAVGRLELPARRTMPIIDEIVGFSAIDAVDERGVLAAVTDVLWRAGRTDCLVVTLDGMNREIPALLSGGARFGIPIEPVRELVPVPPGHAPGAAAHEHLSVAHWTSGLPEDPGDLAGAHNVAWSLLLGILKSSGAMSEALWRRRMQGFVPCRTRAE